MTDQTRKPFFPKRILGKFFGIGMNVNHIIGSGIVTVPGIVLGLVKSPGIVFLLWAIGGFVAMLGSFSYTVLGVHQSVLSRRNRVSGSGGAVKYLQTAFPCCENIASYLFSFMYIL